MKLELSMYQALAVCELLEYAENYVELDNYEEQDRFNKLCQKAFPIKKKLNNYAYQHTSKIIR